MTKDIKKPTLAEKQAFWTEQLPLFKEAYWLPEHFELLKFDMEAGNFVVRDDIDQDFKDDADDLFHRINTGWSMWKRAVNHMQKKLEGCVVVPESEHNEMAQYKDLYKRAIVNAKKRKDQINWAHVAGLGVGSGRAVELCKELNIDPHATDMNVMVEAARGGNG